MRAATRRAPQTLCPRGVGSHAPASASSSSPRLLDSGPPLPTNADRDAAVVAVGILRGRRSGVRFLPLSAAFGPRGGEADPAGQDELKPSVWIAALRRSWSAAAIDVVLHGVVMQARLEGVSIRKIGDLVAAVGMASERQRARSPRICAQLGADVAAWCASPFADQAFPRFPRRHILQDPLRCRGFMQS
jgi:hypothetical protein